ncbi:hypothetical protein [Mesorhizobium sp. P5_C1]
MPFKDEEAAKSHVAAKVLGEAQYDDVVSVEVRKVDGTVVYGRTAK